MIGVDYPPTYAMLGVAEEATRWQKTRMGRHAIARVIAVMVSATTWAAATPRPPRVQASKVARPRLNRR